MLNLVVIGYCCYHSLEVLYLLVMSHICSLLNLLLRLAKTLKQCDECYCFMFNFTYHVAHGGDKAVEVN